MPNSLERSDALNSTLYALAFNEDVGRGSIIGGAAGTAIPAGRAHAALAQHLRVVRPCPAALGDPRPSDGGPSPPAPAGVSAFVPVRGAVVHGQLLLDPRHDDALRRYARRGTGPAAHRVQFGPRPLLWAVWLRIDAGSPGNGQNESRPRCRTLPLGRARPRRSAHHQCSMGSAGVLAGG